MNRYIVKSCVLASLMTSGAAYAGSPGWQISEIKGTVTVSRKGVVKTASRSSDLVAGDIIKTGRSGRAVLTRGGEYLVVAPQSRIAIARPSEDGTLTQIIEYFGNVLFRIDKKKAPHFGVKTPYLAAVVKGTTFSVTVSEEGTAVQVTEGAVEVKTLDDGASQLVTPGMIGMINSSDPFSLVVIDGDRRVIESPNKPVGSPTIKSSSTTNPSSGVTISRPIVSETNGDSGLSGKIAETITEEPIELAALTEGLIGGEILYTGLVAATSNEGEGETASDSEDIGDESDEPDDTDGTTGDQDDGHDGGDDGSDGGDGGDDDDGDDDDGDDDDDDDDDGDDDDGDDDDGDDDDGDDDDGDDDGDDDDGDDDDDDGITAVTLPGSQTAEP